ncbi:uncharacterized protein LOC130809710 [Amaranthus tricolor]|uniref:uncharacterized protein LOC130809710 n=1 Tax=Amaranthus tricolor TaxID=29722 RepID=UPI00258CECBF|nr:uncharacterized protein LOC130809710 [Amaranthus tricolor]
MLSLIRTPFPNVTVAGLRYQNTDVRKFTNYNIGVALPKLQVKQLSVSCSNLTPWEPTPFIYSPTDEAEEPEYKEETPNIFENLKFADTTETQAVESEKIAQKSSSPSKEAAGFLKWPLWVLGPTFLLVTGMVPTLWLPISSIFLGPNIASLLSLVGLDCIFNIGAMLFLLMAHSTTQPKNPTEAPKSTAPFSYQFWNMFASLIGYAIPLALFFGSEKGFLQPQLAPFSYLVLLGPYLLLLSVQILTELLTWHWQSPVWLVTPVIYEAYRVLQLMRGLKLSAEITAPAWMMHTMRGLVCWWVLILGLQLMRVAWFAGFTARSRQQQK